MPQGAVGRRCQHGQLPWCQPQELQRGQVGSGERPLRNGAGRRDRWGVGSATLTNQRPESAPSARGLAGPGGEGGGMDQGGSSFSVTWPQSPAWPTFSCVPSLISSSARCGPWSFHNLQDTAPPFRRCWFDSPIPLDCVPFSASLTRAKSSQINVASLHLPVATLHPR